MGSLYSSVFKYLLLLPIFPLIKTISSTQPICQNSESSALLQFKQSFVINCSFFDNPAASSKVSTWNNNNSNCCLWDGVECDEVSGHVIGLDLSFSCLCGSINSSSSLFNLAHLQSLNLANNDFNMSSLSSRRLKSSSTLLDTFANLSSLTVLNLQNCNLRGLVLSSVGELTQLRELNLADNDFSGEVPSWLANLTQLEFLGLSDNNFTVGDLSWLGNQNKLSYLYLNSIELVGKIPSSLSNLTNLRELYVGLNQLSGEIPSWISNLTQLSRLHLGPNQLRGQIPESIFQLVNLEMLNLQFNYLNGTVRFEMFTRLKDLTALHIPGNNLTLVTTDVGMNATLLKFYHLGIGDCNLLEFPSFLMHQDQLSYLMLHRNRIGGHIPRWVESISRETLAFLFLSDNFISGFDDISVFSSFKKLLWLDLSCNKIKGPLPVPPSSIFIYNVSNNLLEGEIPPLFFCNMSSISSVDLSYNHLTGIIPRCFGSFDHSVIILNLANNFFHGNIPDTFGNMSNLRMIDLSHNQLEGRIPRSFAECKMLESLDLSENHIADKFPFWLGNLPNLEILILRFNRLFGSLQSIVTEFQFPMLHILDLSHNNFIGNLPFKFFESFPRMQYFDFDRLTYLDTDQTVKAERLSVTHDYLYHLVLVNKGVYLKYYKIPNLIAAIDLSSNEFHGSIPLSVGTLKMVNVLNLSNNHLTGCIPCVLWKDTNLESLDLSSNNLSGEIPSQLLQLTFLAYFNVSYNQLSGPIPQGKQFATFDNSSYLGNPELCGNPLTRKCGEDHDHLSQPHPGPTEDGIHLEWKIVIIGYGSGLVIGVVLGLRFFTRHHTWLINTFRIKTGQSRRRRNKRRGHANAIH